MSIASKVTFISSNSPKCDFLRTMKVFLKSSKSLALPAILLSVVMLSFLPFKKKSEAQIQALKESLGRELFFDKDLSNPVGQSCTVCHAPRTMFADPRNDVISEGMIDGRFTNRNSMSLMYVRYIPGLRYDAATQKWKGGLFWDGRSSSLEHQLSGPFFNPAEMNNTDTTMLVSKIRNAAYYPQFKKIYGKSKSDTELYNQMIDALSTFERSELFHPFTSKFDYFLEGKVALSEEEARGHKLVLLHCSPCHSAEPIDGKILFTDFSYHNIGVPRNEDNPFYTTDSIINPEGRKAIDKGLGGFLNDPKQNGKFRVPSLRNVSYTYPYFHNGVLNTLEEVIRFKNERNKGDFGSPEITQNIDMIHTGNMNLSDSDVSAIVKFLYTLDDGYELNQ